MSFESRFIKLKTKTWARDSYGLFDYETKNYFAHNFEIRNPGHLVRDGNEIIFLDESTPDIRKKLQSSKNIEQLAFVTEENGEIVVKSDLNSTSTDINKKLWYVVKETESSSKGYQLKCNDIIKVGRVIFKLKQIKLQDSESQPTTNANNVIYKKSIIDSIKDHFTQLNEAKTSTAKSENPRASLSSICRICLSENLEKCDPLIDPCKCSGSLQFVHLLCLQRWVKSKLNIHENKNLITIYWKNLNCELCKTALPFNIKQDGQEYSIIPIDTNNIGSYVVMESLSKDKEPTGIHIIDISGANRILLGRGHDCDLKIQDISVSRVHAYLNISKGKVYLEDNSSKFGTLVLKKHDSTFSESITVASMQNGRSLLKFNIKRPWISFIPCIGSRSASIMRPSPRAIEDRKDTRIEDDLFDQDDSMISDRNVEKYLIEKEKHQ